MAKRLFVGNLSYDASVSALRSLFESCGDVAEVEVATDGKSGRPRGYALVTMATAAGARVALERLDGESFEGRPLHVVADEEGSARARLAGMIRRLLGYVRYARDHERAAAVSLFLFDETTGDLQGVLAEWDWTRTSFPSHVSEWPTVAEALSKREIRLITADQAFGVEQGWFEVRGIRGSVCVPLCDDERRLGVLFFDFDASAGPVSQADLSFLADVGDRCARALGRSK
ncbi:MAG TPA: GAF domain-containing protein [Polyangiaceae bacterium]|nr:GAF domain-containing protein [Polyangiaceae bacterium]